MVRGILSGAAFGLVTVAIGLSVASLLANQPAGNTPPQVPQVDAPSEAAGDNREGTAPDLAADANDATLEPTEVPLVTTPEDAPDALLADTESAALPETGLTGAELVAPDDPSAFAAPSVAAGTEAPILPNTQSVAPQVPVAEDDLSLATEPAIPTLVEEPVPAIEPDAEPAPEQATETIITPEVAGDPASDVVAALPDDPAQEAAPAPGLETPAESDVAEAEPAAPATLPAETEAPPPPDTQSVVAEEPPEPASADESAVAPEAAPETGIDPAPAEPVVTEAAEEPAPPIAEDATPAPELSAEPTEPTEPDPAATEPTPAEAATTADDEPTLPAVNARAPEAAALPETDGGVRINRPDAEEQAVPDVALTEEPEINLIPLEEGPALERFAAAFENAEGKPLMSVILIDEGNLAGASAAISALPFPVTVALDPGAAGAAERMAGYRAAGIEVMAIARLPQGARPADVMVTFESVFTTLPDTIGVLDAGEGGLQANSAVAEQAMTRFASDGRGVVTLDEGLNMASRAAIAAGVPSGVVYRDLDSEGQSVQVIRRFLDQAAFRARQDSGVILLGRVRADTLSALVLWGDQNRAGQVAVAPVSALLLAQE